MNKRNTMLAFWVMAFFVTIISAEPRFYKANSVKIRYMYNFCDWATFTVDDDGYVSPDYYATMWTGNDTIVDDRHCVTVWNQMDGEEPLCIGCIYEDENSYVWMKYLLAPYPLACPAENFSFLNRWVFLYDFSNDHLSVGDTCYMASNGKPIEYVVRLTDHPYDVILLNGEHVVAFTEKGTYFDYCFYGIGSSFLPLRTVVDSDLMFDPYTGSGKVLEYWRDGELLLNRELVTGMAHINLEPNEASPIYDLLGRPVAHPTKGIYIQNGKKVMIK